MSLLDFLVLVGSMVGIAAYGVWQTRGRQELSHYLKGDRRTGWVAIGLSVMATQASAITFLSTPGQGYQDGLGFVQNYFGAPLALILIAAVFLPMYRRLNVYTAYEYLGRRFDAKTRLLGAALFLLQRGLQAGITIYAPAIILSTVLHWRTDATILLTGLVVIVYTAAGGSQAVNVTQKYQLGVIFCGMFAAFVVLLRRMPAGVGLDDALTLAGGFRKLERGRLLGRPEPTLHVLVGSAGGLLPRAVVLRHRPVAGPALPLGDVAPREPARPDVQRRAQDPDAVLHPAAGDDGVRLLPVRAAAGVLQPGRVGARAGARPRRSPAGPGAAVRRAPRREAARRRGLALRPAVRRPLGRGRGAVAGPGRPRPEPGRPGRGEGRPRVARRPGEVPGHRLRVHHVHPRPPAARDDRPADRRVLRRHALVEGRRAERAGVDDDGRFLSAPRARARPTTRTTWPPRGGSPCCGGWSRSASRSSPAWRRT